MNRDLNDDDWDRIAHAIDHLAQLHREPSMNPEIDLPSLAHEASRGAPEAIHLEPFVLAELVKVDLEHRSSKSVAEYLAEFPQLLPFADELQRERPDEDVPVTRIAPLPLNHTRTLDAPPNSKPETPWVSKRPNLEAGSVLDDFDLLETLGDGSFAQVFLARQRSMLRLVALKVSRLSDAHLDRTGESQTLAQLRHPGIVRVYDQKELHSPASPISPGLHLLYMEVLPGGTLEQVTDAARDRKREGKTLDGRAFVSIVDRILSERPGTRALLLHERTKLESKSWIEVTTWLGSQLARALEYAHRRGVLHCDLKPANVLLTASYRPKLADFNVSRQFGADRLDPSGVAGTVVFMSPEHLEAFRSARADSLDGRSDQYSLALVLAEFATLSRPFVTDLDLSDLRTAIRQLLDVRRSPEALERSLPKGDPEIARILARALSPERNHRYPSLHELALDLELMTDPGIRRTLQSSRTGWRHLAARFPIPTVIGIVLVPNVLAAVFNFVYNRAEIVGDDPEFLTIFQRTQGIINAVSFPLGIVLGVCILRPILRAFSDLSATREDSQPGMASDVDTGSAPGIVSPGIVSSRPLFRLGDRLARLSLAVWLAAGVAYPASLLAAGASFDWGTTLHFFGSLTLCGLIAAAYPFFGVNALVTQAWIPLWLRAHRARSIDPAEARQLGSRSYRYFIVAVAVPMVAVALLVSLGSGSRGTLLVLLAASVAGLATLTFVSRRLRSDVEIIERAATIGSDRGETDDDSPRQ